MQHFRTFTCVARRNSSKSTPGVQNREKIAAIGGGQSTARRRISQRSKSPSPGKENSKNAFASTSKMPRFPSLDVNGNSSNKPFEQTGCNKFDFLGMSRRFSNLQYVSIGILFGTCVFLWTRKLNLVNRIDGGYITSNLRQTARSENEDLLINSWANKIEFEDSPSNGEEIINAQEDNVNNNVRSKEIDIYDKETFSVNNPKASEEVEQVVDIDSSNVTPNDPTVKPTMLPEPSADIVSDAPTPTVENNDESSESSSIAVGTSEALNSPVSTTTITKIVSP